MMAAAHEGNADEIRKLAAAGGNLDAQDLYGWTAIRYAVRSNHIEAVKVLLELGADVNKASSTGRTPLMSAAGNQLEEVAELLVSSGADIMVHDESGKTAWDIAQRSGHLGSSKIRDLVAGGQYRDEDELEARYAKPDREKI